MNQHKLVFATHNKNKVAEIKPLLPEWVELTDLDSLDIKEEIPETGTTLEQNALGKAWYVYNTYGLDCFADDTGLEVDALEGAPGVYSARYAGEPADSQKNMALLLEKMQNKDNRKARFKTVIALIYNGKKWVFEGAVEGSILPVPRGSNGFGYDPLFLPDGHDRCFAEMTLEEKNKISHRAIAMKQLLDFLHDREAGISLKGEGEFA